MKRYILTISNRNLPISLQRISLDLKGKEPFHKRSKSVPNIWNQMSLHSQGEDDLHTPGQYCES